MISFIPMNVILWKALLIMVLNDSFHKSLSCAGNMANDEWHILNMKGIR